MADLQWSAEGDYETGISVQVTFADGSQQTLHKRMPYVNIPDPNLRNALRSELGLPPGDPIRFDQAQAITILDVSHQSIQDTTGIAVCTNLAELNLSGNGIDHLKEMEQLAVLTQLDLSSCELGFLPELPQSIQFFDLSDNQLQKFNQLTSLSALTQADLSHNAIYQIDDLDGLPTLQSLNLFHNQLSTIPRPPSSLQSLDVSNNQITHLDTLVPSSFSLLSSWANLNLSDNLITNLAPLTALHYLSGASLDLRHNLIGNENCSSIAHLQQRARLTLNLQPQSPPVVLNCSKSEGL